MTNTYGITMNGLRDAAKATKRLTGAIRELWPGEY